MSKLPIVCDTTLLLYLDRIGQVTLIPALFEPVFVPETVALELDMGRLLRRDTMDPRQLAWATIISVSQHSVDELPGNRLGPGERAVIAYASAHQYIAGLDDWQARQLAESMGLKIAGILGVLVRAKRAGLIGVVRPLLDAVMSQGFRLSPDLYQSVLELADEA